MIHVRFSKFFLFELVRLPCIFSGSQVGSAGAGYDRGDRLVVGIDVFGSNAS